MLLRHFQNHETKLNRNAGLVALHGLYKAKELPSFLSPYFPFQLTKASILQRYGDMAPEQFWGHDLALLNSRVVISHVIRLAVRDILWVDHASILHCYGDVAPRRFWGHELDLSGSCGVIGYKTVGLAMWAFL